ncbi:bacteriocin ABC transporter [Spiroplasma clarkii]|nr:bacteriocin ABC transporter [Spiroplasma clarkii]
MDGNQEIKTKNLEPVYRNKINSSFNLSLEHENKIDVIKNFNHFIVNLVVKAAFLLTFYIAQILIFKEKLSFEQLLFYVSISAYCTSFSETVLSTILNRETNKIALNEVKLLLESSEENPEIVELETIKSFECKNLYKYKNEVRTVNNINCSINQNTFISGMSGSGKTSFLQLLCGSTNNYEGELLINGIDLKNINKTKLRESVLYLGQYDYLFNGTVWANLQQFKNKIDLELFKQLDF